MIASVHIQRAFVRIYIFSLQLTSAELSSHLDVLILEPVDCCSRLSVSVDCRPPVRTVVNAVDSAIIMAFAAAVIPDKGTDGCFNNALTLDTHVSAGEIGRAHV